MIKLLAVFSFYFSIFTFQSCCDSTPTSESSNAQKEVNWGVAPKKFFKMKLHSDLPVYRATYDLQLFKAENLIFEVK